MTRHAHFVEAVRFMLVAREAFDEAIAELRLSDVEAEASGFRMPPNREVTRALSELGRELKEGEGEIRAASLPGALRDLARDLRERKLDNDMVAAILDDHADRIEKEVRR